MPRARESILVLMLAALWGCAHAAPRPPEATSSLTMARAPAPTHAAHDLVVQAASCWFGGLWGDVQGETPAERAVETQKRCARVVHDAFGDDDRARYEQVRAFEAITVDEVAAKVASLADADREAAPRKDALVKLTRAIADAQRETMVARRAAHRILRDAERERAKLSDDESAALPELEAAKAWDALLRLDAGPLQQEAHVYALLVALDRMNLAQELPLHLKPYPVIAPFHALFGAAVPDLPHDASRPLPRAGWLTYLGTVASAAGHPIASSAAPPQIRHEQAIAGIFAGISDRLKTDAQGVEPPLRRIVEYVIRDLDAVIKATAGPGEPARADAVEGRPSRVRGPRGHRAAGMSACLG